MLFSRSHNSYEVGVLEMERGDAGPLVTAHRCGCVGLQLIRITGSAFARFARDEYTTLPERTDRPLFIYLDVYWRYTDPAHAISADLYTLHPHRADRDFVGAVFHGFVSMSIQHLVHEMGTRLLERFPQMGEVSFEAQKPSVGHARFESQADPKIKVYTDPRPPYGMIKLTLGRR